MTSFALKPGNDFLRIPKLTLDGKISVIVVNIPIYFPFLIYLSLYNFSDIFLPTINYLILF